jgi:uncharacterized membrane protein YkoI
MKIKHLIVNSLAMALIAGGLTACSCMHCKESKEKSQAKLEATAKISRADAEKTALAKVPGGTIKEGEIEKEKGRLIWSFDIAQPGTKDIKEVNVDAMTGEVVSVETETEKDQKKEKD